MSLECSSLCQRALLGSMDRCAKSSGSWARLRHLEYILWWFYEWMPGIHFLMNLYAVTLHSCTRSSLNTHLAPIVLLKYVKINTKKPCICCFKNRNKQGVEECRESEF